MTHTRLSQWIAIGTALIVISISQTAHADTDRPTTDTPVSAHPAAYHQRNPAGGPTGTGPVYRPPHRLAPSHGLRVGGGTRALTGLAPAISALAPDHIGLTLQKHPTLYWHSAAAVTVPLEFTMIEERTGLPLLEIRLPHPIAPGIHALRLADYGIELHEGEIYSWSVALVMDPDRRSKDVMAFGSIARIAAADLPSAFDADSADRYAGAGLWYDALHALSASLALAPLDRDLRAKREALLHQIGLSDVIEPVDAMLAPVVTRTN